MSRKVLSVPKQDWYRLDLSYNDNLSLCLNRDINEVYLLLHISLNSVALTPHLQPHLSQASPRSSNIQNHITSLILYACVLLFNKTINNITTCST